MTIKRKGGKVMHLKDIFEQLGERAGEAAKNAFAKGADIIADEAKNNAPVKTGALRDSIHVVMNKEGSRAKIVADARSPRGKHEPYGRLVEFDPAINEPFLYPAYDAKRDEVKGMVIDSVREAVRKS